MLVTSLAETLKQVTLFYKIFQKYNVSKLGVLKNQIQSGELVPVDSVNPSKMIKFINKELLVFYKFGYKLDGSSKDIIEYMGMFVDNINKGELQKIFESASKSPILTPKKDKFSSELFSRLKGVEFDINPKSNNFYFGMLMRMFSSKLSLMSYAFKKGETPMHADIIQLKRTNEVIEPFSAKEAIALLDFGVNKKEDINKALSTSKKIFVGSSLLNYFKNVATNLTGPAAALISYYTRLLDNYPSYVTDKIYNFTRYDKIIIDLINLTFEKKK